MNIEDFVELIVNTIRDWLSYHDDPHVWVMENNYDPYDWSTNVYGFDWKLEAARVAAEAETIHWCERHGVEDYPCDDAEEMGYDFKVEYFHDFGEYLVDAGHADTALETIGFDMWREFYSPRLDELISLAHDALNTLEIAISEDRREDVIAACLSACHLQHYGGYLLEDHSNFSDMFGKIADNGLLAYFTKEDLEDYYGENKGQLGEPARDGGGVSAVGGLVQAGV